MLETSALVTLYGGQFILSTHLIKSNYVLFTVTVELCWPLVWQNKIDITVFMIFISLILFGDFCQKCFINMLGPHQLEIVNNKNQAIAMKWKQSYFWSFLLIDTLKPGHKSVLKTPSSQRTKNECPYNYENISMLLSGQNVRICMGINSSTLNLNI